jgi:hypothetical protein
MTNKQLLSVAGLAAFVGYCFQRGQCATTAKTAKTQVKEDLHRWEGEGGNVPAVATPSPAPTPRSSFPAAGTDARH